MRPSATDEEFEKALAESDAAEVAASEAMSPSESAFWSDPANVPQYDTDAATGSKATRAPLVGPEDEPIDVPSGRQPLPMPSEPFASTDRSFRPPPRTEEAAPPKRAPADGEGFDWKRALTHLFSGQAGVSDLDRLRQGSAAAKAKAATDAEERSYKQEELKLKRDKFGLERDLLAPAKAGKMNADAASKAMLVGTTPESKEIREAVAARFELQAKTLADSPYGAMFAQAAADMRRRSDMSGKAALDVAKQYNVSVDDIAAAAAQKFKEGDVTADNKRADRRLALDEKRYARAAAAAQAKGAKAANAKFQEKLNGEMTTLQYAREALTEALNIKTGKATGKPVNTGWLANKGQQALQMVDMASDEYNDLEGLLAMVNNRVTKEFGGANVTASEWGRISRQLATLDKDDKNFETKIKRVLAELDRQEPLIISKYQRNDDGTPIDKSNTARAATKMAPAQTPGETAAKPAPHGQIVKQGGRTFEWNGTKYVEKPGG